MKAFPAGLICLLVTACLPQAHSIEGRACQSNDDCGPGFACFRLACTKEGSVREETIDGPTLAREVFEFGIERFDGGLRRAPTAFGLGVFSVRAALPQPTVDFSLTLSAQGAVIAGGSTDGGVSAAVWTLVDQPSADGGLRAWSPSTALPAPRDQAAAVTAVGRVFVIGGRGADGTLLSEVQVADFSAEKPEWKSTTPLPSGRRGAAAVVSQGRVYLVGGNTSAGVASDVLMAPIAIDGTLGAWKVAATFPQGSGRSEPGAVVWNGTLYVVGGSCSAGCETLTAKVLDDGTLDLWNVGTSLPAPLIKPAVVATGGALYVLGGKSSTGVPQRTVLGAQFLADGALGEYKLLRQLPQAIAGAAASAERIIFVGSSLAASPAYSVPLRGGALGAWNDAPSLPEVREAVMSAVSGDWVFVVGGKNHNATTNTYRKGVLKARVLDDGGISGWTDAGQLETAVAEGVAFAHHGRLYVAGGTSGDGDSRNDVQVATIGPEGSLSAFVSGRFPGKSLGVLGAAASGDYLYVVGGIEGYGPRAETFTQVGRLNPDSGLPQDWRSTTALPVPLSGFAMVVDRGRLIVAGGSTDFYDGYSDRVLIGSLAPDGLISGWTAAPTMKTARTRTAGVIHDDHLFVSGGCNDSATSSYCDIKLDSVESAPLLSDGGLGPFETQNALGYSRLGHALASVRGQLVAIGGYDGNPQDFVEQVPVLSRGSVRTWATAPALTAPLPNAAVASGNGTTAVIGSDATFVSIAVDGGFEWKRFDPPAARGTAALANGVIFSSSGADTAFAALSTTGLGAWKSGPALPAGIPGAAAAAWNRHIYMVGNAVYRSTVQADGSLSAWTTEASLPLPRAGAKAFTWGSRLFVAGGIASDLPSKLVVQAPINADGSLGLWSPAGTLPATDLTGLAQAHGYLFINSAAFGVSSAPIRSDGQLGVFTPVQSPAGQSDRAFAVVNGRLLSMTGAPEVWSGQLDVSAAEATFFWQRDFGSPVQSIESVALLSSSGAPGTFRVSARVAGADGVWSPTFPVGQGAAGEELPLKKANVKKLQLQVTLDDSLSATGGADPGSARRDVQALRLTIRP